MLSIYYLCEDFTFPITLENVFPGLVIEICIVVGDGIVDPGTVNFYQDVYESVSVITGNIFNQSFVYLTDRPIIWDSITTGCYVIKRTLRDVEINDKVIRSLFNRLTVEYIRIAIDALDYLFPRNETSSERFSFLSRPINSIRLQV